MTISLSDITKMLLLVVLCMVGAFLFTPQQALAVYNIPVGGIEIEGFAWSGYSPGPAGVGWISFNCTMPGAVSTCASNGGVDYAVTLQDDGNLTGYAWSPNIGWIDFSPDIAVPGDEAPVGAGVANASALAVSGDFNGDLQFGGWARACAVFADPNTCSGALDPSAGGWDGWIALGGTAAGGYGVTMTPSGATANSYAWGGPINVGWIDWSPSGYDPVSYAPPMPNILGFTATPAVIPVNTTTALVYEVENAQVCSISNDSGTEIYLSSGPIPVGPITVITPTITADTTFTLTCSNGSQTADSTTFVDVRADLQVLGPSFSASNQDPVSGVFQDVTFSFSVVGSMYSGTAFDYTVKVTDLDTGIDVVSYTDSIPNNAGPINITTPNVGPLPFISNPEYSIEIDTDKSVNAYGDIQEMDESNNQVSAPAVLPAPNPIVTIVAPEIVKLGEQADIEITISSVGDTNCTLYAPGVAAIPPISGSASSIPPFADVSPYGPSTFTTSALSNTTNVVVECSVVGSANPFRTSEQIEVTPSFQEV